MQAIPNITAQTAAGVDNSTDTGLINVQFGAPIPVFNQNQGNITAARAEYCRAVIAQLAQAFAKIDGKVLTGALDAVTDQSGDDSLRGLTFSQQ